MGRERAWRDGSVVLAVRVGLLTGVFFGAFSFATGRSLQGALIGGGVFGVLFGPFTAVKRWRDWPGASALAMNERIAVTRAVSRGDANIDPDLAPAVLEYASLVREARESEREWGVLRWLFPAIVLAVTVVETISGSTRAVVWWVLVGFSALIIWRERRQRAGVIARAVAAEEAARGNAETVGVARRQGVRSSFCSQASTDARVPGVSAGSIAANTFALASMASAVSKY